MKELMECAAASGASFEIYSRSVISRMISIEGSELKNAETSISSGVSLRLLKDGRSGFSFTSNLKAPGDLVNSALVSLRAGVESDFRFPGPEKYAELKTCSGAPEAVSSEDLLAEGFRVRDELYGKSRAQVNVLAKFSVSETSIINSNGVNVGWRDSCAEEYGTIVDSGGGKYVSGNIGFELGPMAGNSLSAAAHLFEGGRTEVRPAGGRRNVLFMPRAMGTLLWRVQSGASGQSLHQKTSPLAGKIGEKVFSTKLTLKNNPLDDSVPGARFIDDEGVPCRDFSIIEKGVFSGFYFDLNYAAKNGVANTGHGFRRSAWGGDPVMMRPQPYLTHLFFEKGEKNFKELLAEMGSGIIVFGTLGAHTGNVPNGDFSMGLSLGMCVENGRIVGKAKDTMISGNIYDVMKRAVAVGGESDSVYGNNPPVLFEGVDVSS